MELIFHEFAFLELGLEVEVRGEEAKSNFIFLFQYHYSEGPNTGGCCIWE